MEKKVGLKNYQFEPKCLLCGAQSIDDIGSRYFYHDCEIKTQNKYEYDFYVKRSGCYKDHQTFHYELCLDDKTSIDGFIKVEGNKYCSVIEISIAHDNYYKEYEIFRQETQLEEQEIVDLLLKISKNIDLYLTFK